MNCDVKRTKINEKEAGIGPYFFKKTFNNKQFKYLSHITRAILGEKDITYFLFLFESNLVKVETSRRRTLTLVSVLCFERKWPYHQTPLNEAFIKTDVLDHSLVFCPERWSCLVTGSVTRLGDLLDFGPLCKAFGNN